MAYQIVILKQLNEGCAAVRKAVFMEEQGFQQEFDDVDDRAYHVLIQDGERPVATGRLFTEDGETYLTMIEDDDEFEEVYQAFEERLSDLFFDDERTDSESEEDGE